MRRSAARREPKELQVFQSFVSVSFQNLITLDTYISKYTFSLFFEFSSLLHIVDTVPDCVYFWRATDEEFDQSLEYDPSSSGTNLVRGR